VTLGWLALASLLALAACNSAPPPLPAPPPAPAPPPPPPATAARPGGDLPTKGVPGADTRVKDSVWLAIDRASKAPADYGLYTVVLARSADSVTARLLSDLFTSTVGAGDSPMRHVDLNLVTIPVKKVSDTTRLLATARNQPAAAAAELLQKHYDFGEAALLMAEVCESTADKRVVKACGSPMPDGPLLVTAVRPIDGQSPPQTRLLIVNLGNTPPEAVPEILRVYRRQIASNGIDGRGELDGWRLKVLNTMLEAADILPLIRKSYASNA
jgi:hypothetical protein